MENNTSVCPNCSAWHLTALRITEPFPCLLPTLAWTFWFLLCVSETDLSAAALLWGKKRRGKRQLKAVSKEIFVEKPGLNNCWCPQITWEGAGGQHINTWGYWVIRILSHPLFPSFLLAFSICFLVIWVDKGRAKGTLLIIWGQRMRILQKQAVNLTNFY